jgi:hypothetical protein
VVRGGGGGGGGVGGGRGWGSRARRPSACGGADICADDLASAQLPPSRRRLVAAGSPLQGGAFVTAGPGPGSGPGSGSGYTKGQSQKPMASGLVWCPPPCPWEVLPPQPLLLVLQEALELARGMQSGLH